METGTRLFVEVFGMIAIAAYLSLGLVRDRPVFEGPEREHLPEEFPLLTTSLFCPDWALGADVVIGLDNTGPKPFLKVTSCDLLLEGETCDMACVKRISQA
jgi:hypothetical protein